MRRSLAIIAITTMLTGCSQPCDACDEARELISMQPRLNTYVADLPDSDGCDEWRQARLTTRVLVELALPEDRAKAARRAAARNGTTFNDEYGLLVEAARIALFADELVAEARDEACQISGP